MRHLRCSPVFPAFAPSRRLGPAYLYRGIPSGQNRCDSSGAAEVAAKSVAGCWFKSALDWSGLFDIGAAKDDQYGLLDIGAPSYDQCGPFALNESVAASPEGLELTGQVCIDYLAPFCPAASYRDTPKPYQTLGSSPPLLALYVPHTHA
jgi:hypothetical protein